ncbi:hypothetical protein AcV7_002644 [Taiwanofungus camphoratus]|nr:hypothetical protein AcV7_002644 [Antrodia cinnamomea]
MKRARGRAFAWQENIIVLASVFQKFDLEIDDPSYELEVKQTLTIKPEDLYIHAIPCKDKARPLVMPDSAIPQARRCRQTQASPMKPPTSDHEPKQPLYVVYSLTRRHLLRESDTHMHGIRPTIRILDSVVKPVPADGLFINITISFEGEPADDAAHSVAWVRCLEGNELAKVAEIVIGSIRISECLYQSTRS